MKKVCYYEAEDGTTFESEGDCREYEYKISHLPKSIFLWKGDNNLSFRVEPFGLDEIIDAYNDFNICEIIDTDTWKEDVKYMVDYYGFSLFNDITEPGVYVLSKDGEHLINQRNIVKVRRRGVIY